MTIGAAALTLFSCTDGDGTLPTLSVDSPTAVSFNAAGGEKIISVTTNQDSWDVTMTPADGNGWLRLDKFANAFTLNATANTETVSPASVSVVVTAGTAQPVIMTITQKPFEPNLPTYAVGDYYPDGTNPIGVVFWVDPASSSDGGATGTSGKAVGLDQPDDHMKWIDTATAAFGTNADDGQANTAAFINSGSTLSGAVKWCIDKGDGWYMPANNEYKRLYAAMSGVVYEDVIDSWTGFSGMPDAADYADARTAFNQKFTDAAGIIFNPNFTYWTSTEYSDYGGDAGSQAWAFGVWGGSLTSGLKARDTYFVRCMYAF